MEQSRAESALLLAKRIAAQYSELPQVQAVVFSGSQTNQVAEETSDIDLYVYFNDEISISDRKKIASQFATRMEVNNQFWESGDEWIDEASGIHIDVMFRHIHWIENQIEGVLIEHKASIGYSTCFWHNVLTSQSLVDKNGWFEKLQIKATQPYPDDLQRNIITKNHSILRNNLSSYSYQLKKALQREDVISINHRIAALIASYFDILFAINKLPHPGEKRLIQIAKSKCQYLPDGFQEDLSALLARDKNTLIHAVNKLIDGLDALLKKQGLLLNP